jgi:hypothetical protein
VRYINRVQGSKGSISSKGSSFMAYVFAREETILSMVNGEKSIVNNSMGIVLHLQRGEWLVERINKSGFIFAEG